MWVKQTPPVKKTALTPLLRPGPGAEIFGHLCGEPLRVFLHYASGRSWPCVGRGCCLCEEQIPRRYYAYYPVRDHKNVLGIMELTSQAEDQLVHQMSPVTQVTCGRVWLRRGHGRRNAPCTIEWKESEENGKAALKTLDTRDLQNTLLHIWKLPIMREYENEDEWLRAINRCINARTIRRQEVAQNP